MLAHVRFCASQLVCLCPPQSQLRNHEKEHENLTSDTTAFNAIEGIATAEDAEREIGGRRVFSSLLYVNG